MHHSNLQTRGPSGRFAKDLPPNLGPINLPLEAPPVEFNENYGTSQIYSRGFEFAFMSNVGETYKQACTFVYCKDFLHDAVWAYVNRTKWQIFGFHYDTAKDTPLDLENCVFAFRNTQYKGKEEEFHGSREACQEFINQLEEKMGFASRTKIYEVPHQNSPCWLIVGDKGWQHAPPMVGLFTLIIRVGFMHKLGESADQTLQRAKEGKIKIGDNTSYAGNRDCSYIAQAWAGIQAILKHGLNIFYPEMSDNYPEDLPRRGASLHDAFGPVNFTLAATRKDGQGNPTGAKKAMPRWYEDKYWE